MTVDRDESSTEMIKKPSPLPWVLLGLAVVAAVVLAITGYQTLEEEKGRSAAALKASDDALHKLRQAEATAKALADRVAVLEDEKKSLAAHANALADEVADKDTEADQAKAAHDALEEKLSAELRKGEVRLTLLDGRLRVDLLDKVLFDPGGEGLSPRGAEVLLRLAAVLATVQGRTIQVAGHTDDGPVPEKLAERYPSNWELSSSRAVSVVRFLAEKGGIPPARLLAAGHGEFQPVATNGNPAGRARNRRIEVSLLPLPGQAPKPAPEEEKREKPTAKASRPAAAAAKGKKPSARK